MRAERKQDTIALSFEKDEAKGVIATTLQIIRALKEKSEEEEVPLTTLKVEGVPPFVIEGALRLLTFAAKDALIAHYQATATPEDSLHDLQTNIIIDQGRFAQGARSKVEENGDAVYTSNNLTFDKMPLHGMEQKIKEYAKRWFSPNAPEATFNFGAGYEKYAMLLEPVLDRAFEIGDIFTFIGSAAGLKTDKMVILQEGMSTKSLRTFSMPREYRNLEKLYPFLIGADEFKVIEQNEIPALERER